MKLLPFLAALILLAELVGAVLFFVDGQWLPGALLVVGVAAVFLIVVRLAAAVTKPPQTAGYVERESTFY
jgi:F0F1-type ATP synthase assembly protein I